MRTKIYSLKNFTEEHHPLLEKEVNIKGWIRTMRKQKGFAFIEMNDGSTLSNFQVIVDASFPEYESRLAELSTGAAVDIEGKLVESPGKNQNLELHATSISLLGACSAEEYPLQKKRHSFEFLRTIAHLRPRTNTIGAMSRVRSALAFATHQFFQNQGFLYVNTPIITGADCEGAGQQFQVTTLDLNKVAKTKEGAVDYSKDFFEKPTYLTVSGQLNGEVFATALSDIYTFGPTFRAENSNTSRHVAEFWMIEPEMAFADINDNMDCAEAYLKYIFKYALDHCKEDMAFFDKWVSKGVIARLQEVIDDPFVRVSYTDAVEILKKAPQKFEYAVEWGCDLQTEHERYLVEKHFKKPVIVKDYPKTIKAFYMRGNDDDKTVAAIDVLVAGVGEIIGGSQREERLDVLEEKLKLNNLPKEEYWWYLELRKYGSVPHSGFGAGFERLVQFVTGLENIRDVIPFPRYPGRADF